MRMSIMQSMKGWFFKPNKFGHHGSDRLSIQDMVSMSDEELGREFKKYGEWTDSEKNFHIEDIAYIIHFAGLRTGLISLIVLVIGWFATFHVGVSHLVFLCAGAVLIMSILAVCSVNTKFMKKYAKKKYGYDKFDVLGFNDIFYYEIFEHFIESLKNTDSSSNNESLSNYIHNICIAINRYHGYDDDGDNEYYFNHIVGPSDAYYGYHYSDNETGRMLKLIIPIVYMKQHVHFDGESFDELDKKLDLTNKVIAFNEDIDRRKNEQQKRIENLNRAREEAGRLKKDRKEEAGREEKAAKIRQHQEHVRKTQEAISDFISLSQESEHMRNNPDYARIEDASKRLNESKDSLVEKVGKTADNG